MRCAMLWVAVTALAAEKGYVAPETCRTCHQGIYDSYAKTGMGRSFYKVTELPALKDFLHDKSQRKYSIAKQGSEYFLRREHPDGVVVKQIDAVIGSGNHSRTLVHRDARGTLFELPVSWYSENGGYWAMSPGYDRPDHSDFRREVSEACLFCHNGYPSEANGGLAQGIDCQRCHGPGEQHVQQKGKMLNPANLSPTRQMDICLECHLESSSRTLPDAIRRFNRGPFSFRPGEALGDFKLYFDFTDRPRQEEDRITVNGAGYGLLQSQCYRKSDRMMCTTCHDPHVAYRGVAAEERYRAACRSCHATVHESGTRDCASCHMPKRRTEDAVHVLMTDHRIRRQPPSGDLLAPLPERHDRLAGAVKLLYPPRIPPTAEMRLYQAVVQIQVSGNLRDDLARLEQAIREARPPDARAYRALAEAYRKAGRTKEAIEAYENARQRDSSNRSDYIALAGLIGGSEGRTLLEKAVSQFPEDTAVLNALAVFYVRAGRLSEAAELLSRALRADPDDPASWLNLGVCLQAKADKKGAEAAYRQALLLQPDLTKARDYLNAILERKF